MTRTAMCSCWIRKRTFHFYMPGVVQRAHAAAWQVRALMLLLLRMGNLMINKHNN